MPFCKNHNFLYFDNLRRTEKAETVLCLIHASYQAKIKGGTKDDIVRMLKNAYELFRFDAGSYTGENASQFASQYTIGHELGIWLNSNLDLCSLATKVAKNEITITDYFDIFFLNYIQPIDNVINHPLYSTLKYAQDKEKTTITKDDLKKIYANVSQPDHNNINGLFNMFIGSSYFTKVDENTLCINYPINDILNCCNLQFNNADAVSTTSHFSELKTYIDYLTTDHRSIELIKDKFHFEKFNNPITKSKQENAPETIGYNKIFYGIPGCGKSYKIDAMLNHKPEFVDEAIKNKIATKAEESDVIRTTFYLDYSNSDFIGQIYPCVEKVEVNNEEGPVDYKSIVTYKRIPGPFTKALLRAYQHLIDEDNSQVYLIIEEINRGNAAAIFGDTFQLLDRKNGDSEYPINNEFIESYLRENLENIENLPSNYNLERIMIPHNLTIFATMNTSDQNVFPLDTAFKRRWNRERITNDWGKVGHIKDMYIPYTDITWENFAKTINEEMISQSIKKDAPISEDKQMGAYFANEDMLTDKSYSEKIKENISLDKDLEKLNNFENNILDYLYNDVTKFDHSILFEKQLNSIDNIYERINLYIDAINDTGAEQAESKCVFNKVFVDEITEQMLGFVTKVDDSDD